MGTPLDRIGYLVPEFPGQTHSFFWRELEQLRELGIEPVIVSTRKPVQGIVCHDWAESAMAQTTYLVPPAPTVGAAAAAAARLVRPSLLRCLPLLAHSGDVRTAGRRSAAMLLGAQLATLARREDLRHVHVHSCGDAANIALFSRLLGGPSYSLTLHGPLEDYGPHQAEKWSHAAFGIVITHKLRAEVERELAGAMPPRVEVAPMGVDLARFRRPTPYLPWGGSGQFRIFSCGRLNPVKGHTDLATAVALLRERGLDAHLTIAGEDDAGGTGYRRELEAEIRRIGVGPHVDLLGAVTERRIRDGLISSHAFALASHNEPLGVAIMEAMALSLPVVVTRAGGVAELVDDDVDGVFTPARDPTALADTLAQLAHDPARARRLSDRARSKIEQQFGSARSAELIVSLIGTLHNAAVSARSGATGRDEFVI